MSKCHFLPVAALYGLRKTCKIQVGLTNLLLILVKTSSFTSYPYEEPKFRRRNLQDELVRTTLLVPMVFVFGSLGLEYCSVSDLCSACDWLTLGWVIGRSLAVKK